MRVGMIQSNAHLGPHLLDDISNPDSANYGKHYTVEQVHDIFAPSAGRVAAVRAWLEGAGIDAERISQSANKQWMQFDAKVREAEDLLNATFHVYERIPTSKVTVGCDEYHIPEDLKEHIGDRILIFYQGNPQIGGGTSASAPVFASILTRINDVRLKAGKSTVGFVNPTLNPHVLHDITVGDNGGCMTHGFNASKGWDLVTGLGTPNYPAMLKLFSSLP